MPSSKGSTAGRTISPFLTLNLQAMPRQALATRSDLTLQQQIAAPGATWLDRQLLAREPVATGGGFGAQLRDALERRVEHLAREGLARRQGQRASFSRDLLNTLRRRELSDVAGKIAAETELVFRPSPLGPLDVAKPWQMSGTFLK